MWLEIKTDLMWWWWWVVVGVEGENRNKLGACQKHFGVISLTNTDEFLLIRNFTICDLLKLKKI